MGVVGTLTIFKFRPLERRCLGKSVRIGTLKLGVQIRECWLVEVLAECMGFESFLDREADDHSVCCLLSVCYVQTHCTHHPLLP